MVAIWKAGGAVTTMDPTYPDKRLQSMLQETMCKLIFVDLEHASRFKKIGLQVIDDLEHLEDDLVGPINHKDLERSWEIADVKPDHLAQVAWTSGSTGRPKGVLHSHGRLTSEHNSYKWNLEYNGGQRVLQFGSYAYVAGVNDTFHTFLHGATLCIPSESERTSCLADFMKGAGVTRAYLTPSVLRTISPDLVPTLKYLCVGGETVDRDLVEKWSNCVHLSSLYGASEGGFMIHQSAHLQYLSQGLLPIGGNAWLVCPNDSEQLVPIGVPGEIIFESHELALGYLNDPQKTAKTFIDPPRWAQKRANLYGYRYLRMGDLARYESDGSIVILGRADNQVKINGQRVELQDVEYHLHQSLPTDSRAIAEIVKPIDAPNTKFLTAFCSLPSGEQLISLEDQRLMIQRLQERLRLSVPAHMVPRAFIFLDDIPGDYKVDRRKLRADASQLGLKALLKTAELSSVPASDLSSTDMESTIAQLWTQILPRKSPHIAPSDNFIALGGDSVAAMRLVSVARANGLALTSQLIFEHPVLSDLAAVMESTNSCSASSVDTVAPASQESSRLTATDFQAWAVEVGAQNGGWIDHFIYDFTGALDVGRLQSSCLQLAMDHPILRAVFSYSAGSVVTFSTSTNMIPFEYHDCSPTNLEATSKAIFYRDRPAALGLPVSRFDLLVVSPMQHRLILRISHAQYDSVSARLIHDHLRHLYLGQPTLPPVSVAEYLRYIQRHSIVSAAKRYWRGSLRGSQMPVLARHSTSSEARHNLDGEVRRYRADLAAALMPKGITLATAVKVAWGATLATLTGQMDVVFGDFVSGRQIGFQDVGRVVCACVNFAAVRVDFDRDGKTWYEVLQQVQREALTGSKHEVLGWRKILGCIGTGDLKRWSSIVNFITVDLEDQLDESRAWDAVTGTEKLEVNVGYEEHQFDKTDLWLLVRRLPGRKSANMEFYLRYSKSRHSRSAVEGIADLFCDTLQSLSTDETLSMEVELPVLGDAERERLIPYKNSCTD
ncbi:hypothetical protein KVT40_004452 [Elsinoe batatas]|uniref:Carrier domain-containing protein n=1 Tax=Elsinoe batatas TaxID=2601811 RepID=A0A8K0L2P8_9PEZI|nr:hypothetical protein KVT40_004452 [Elsinoe batatas]